MIRFLCLAFVCFLSLSAHAQRFEFTRADTLRGTVTPERAWWDLNYYHLSVRANPADSSFRGSTQIAYTVLKPNQTLQVDLQRPMRITRIEQDGQSLTFRQEGDAYFVTLQKPQQTGRREAVTVFYEGKPHVARNAPWDGGVVWAKDAGGQTFLATACQGLGASAWWPCKDHMYDEPDSMLISVTVPEPLTDVSNGRLRRVTRNPDGTRTFDWAVTNPINNYGVNLNAARYVHWTDSYAGEKGNLDLSYYALRQDSVRARAQYAQVPLMLKAFEHWFGPYPFYEDGFKLVQVPYLGMEHQSSVTYGNRFNNGYLGRDLSGTGWGLLWDFIIIHESGHEWFANNITYRDMADMWIHESFTNYSENLYVEYYHGKEAGAQYVIGCRKNIRNDRPIIGFYNVNKSGSGDMYYKGGNLLHTIRQVIGNDERWRQILRGLNQTFYHQTVTTAQIETYVSEQAGRNLQKVFDQYLRDTRIPTLEYRVRRNQIEYRWANCVAGFDMPVRVCLDDANAYQNLQPTANWQRFAAKNAGSVNVDANYYVNVRRVD